MEITRRGLLKTAAGAVASGMGGTLSLRDLAAYAAEPPPATLQFDSEIEAIVRLIEETPRERCVPVFIDQVRRGLPYRRFLAAAFFACVRKQHSHHDVYKIHSVHQVSMDVRPEERLLPLFWALNAFKQRQEDFPARSLTKLNGPFPSPEIAASEFRDAMQSTDMERAESALITLARNQGARPTMELLWSIGCRNGHAGGHGAISVANCFRALETIGWQQAESVLRFVVQDLFFLQYVKPDAYFETNSARVDQHLNSLPQDWAGDKADPEATHELFQLLRQGQATRHANWRQSNYSARLVPRRFGMPFTWRPRN